MPHIQNPALTSHGTKFTQAGGKRQGSGSVKFLLFQELEQEEKYTIYLRNSATNPRYQPTPDKPDRKRIALNTLQSEEPSAGAF